MEQMSKMFCFLFIFSALLHTSQLTQYSLDHLVKRRIDHYISLPAVTLAQFMLVKKLPNCVIQPTICAMPGYRSPRAAE